MVQTPETEIEETGTEVLRYVREVVLGGFIHWFVSDWRFGGLFCFHNFWLQRINGGRTKAVLPSK